MLALDGSAYNTLMGQARPPHGAELEKSRARLPRTLALAAAACLALGALTPVPAAAQSVAFCAPGQQPAFQLGFAQLKARLGARMGDPTECEHPNTANADVLQHTTTGLAIFNKNSNLATFTNGGEHWALQPTGLAHWSGPSPDPPQATSEDLVYLTKVVPLLLRIQGEGEALKSLGSDLTGGAIDIPSAQAELQAVRDDFGETLQLLQALPPSPTLAHAHASLLDFANAFGVALGQLQDSMDAAQAGDLIQVFTLVGQAQATIANAQGSIEDVDADFRALTP
jgi:hypothetical protein